MRALRLVLAALVSLTVVACRGEGDASPPRVMVVRATLKDNGRSVLAEIDARLEGGTTGGRVSLWTGVRAPSWEAAANQACPGGCDTSCDRYVGWRLDLSAQDAAIVLAPGETRELSLRATSRRAPSCAPRRALAACDEEVAVVLGTEGAVAASDEATTVYHCELGVFAPR